jgi:hypothetical protein
MNIEYLSGRVEGPFVKERVQLGDITVTNQIVGIASKLDIPLLDDVDWDGILGLAFPTKSMLHQGVLPFFDTVMHQQVLTEKGLANQFSYTIDDDRGFLTLGGVDCSLIGGVSENDCISKFQLIEVVARTYWTILLTDVYASWPGQDREQLRYTCPQGGCKTIVDTGTYLIYGPSSTVKAIFGQRQWCDDNGQMPTLTFVFVGDIHTGATVSISLAPVDYVLNFHTGEGEAQEEDGYDCVVGISPDTDPHAWTLGQVFLRSFYTLFDRDDNRVGFAPLHRKKNPVLHQ